MSKSSWRVGRVSRHHRARALRLEHLEERQLLAIDLVSSVSDPALLGDVAAGESLLTTFAVSGDGRYVAFESAATNLVAGDTNGMRDVFVKDLQSGAITRASTDSHGAQAEYREDAWNMMWCPMDPVISADGRYVAFSTSDSNLVPGDTNQSLDVFVKDLVSGATTCVSTDSSAVQADDSSFATSISADGRYVAFESDATNLVVDDTNGLTDLFVKDLVSGATTRVNTDSSGAVANSWSDCALLSADGRYVVFDSDSSNLVAGDAPSGSDVFMKDLVSGATIRVSTDSSGVAANSSSFGWAISSDGRYVAFESLADNLVAGDTNGFFDVFVKDLVSGTTTRVSTDSIAAEANGDSLATSMSADGRYVAFLSAASNLVADDSNGCNDVFVKDLLSGATTLVSVDGDGGQGNNACYLVAISADGTSVAFESYASNLVEGDTNNRADVFVRNLQDGTTTLVSTRDPAVSGAVSANGYSEICNVSRDGRYVVFQSGASNLVADDTNGVDDVFMKDLVSGVTTRVSTDSHGSQADYQSYWPSVSGDGRYVIFQSEASNLVADDTNLFDDVFVKDTVSGVTTRVNTSSSGEQSDAGCDDAVISSDGRYVVFTSCATNLVADDTNGWQDVFVKDLQTGAVTRVNVAQDGTAADGDSNSPAVSGDGRYVTFVSAATNLVANDTNALADVFVKDVQSGVVTRVSTASDGAEGNDWAYGVSAISDDGRYVTFTSVASNLVDGDTNVNDDVFLKDLQSGVTVRVSTAANGAEANGHSQWASLSGDGRYVVFMSEASDLVDGGVSSMLNVFVKDVQTGAIARLSEESDGTPANSVSVLPMVSGDGRYVVFSSYATNLVEGDGNLECDVFRAANVLANQAPSGIVLDNSTVTENSAAGTLVGTLSTTDLDVGDTFTYSLIDNAGGRFKIVGDQVLVDDGSLLDYETAASHLITVQTTDAGGASFVQRLTITLIDVHEFDSVAVFDPRSSTFYLRSENASGSADYAFGYGVPGAGWQTLVGDWHGDGSSGVGLYDESTSTFYLTGAYVSGVAEYTFGYGVPPSSSTAWTPRRRSISCGPCCR